MQLSSGEQVCARELLDALPPLMWFIRKKMRTFRRGLSVPQFRALVYVENNRGACVRAVADHLGASMPTTSRIIATLVRRGLLIRQACSQDRRQHALSLASRGQSVLKTAWRQTERELAEQLARLSATQRKAIVESTAALKSVFGSLHQSRSNPQSCDGQCRR